MAGVHQRFHKTGADEAAAAGDENLAHACAPFFDRRRRDVDPGALLVRAPRRIDQLLHAVAFGKARRGVAAVLDGIEEEPGQPRHRRDAAVGIFRVGRIVDRDAFQRRRPLGVKQFEAAHVVGARIVQHQRAVLAEEFDAVADAEIRRAAHRQA